MVTNNNNNDDGGGGGGGATWDALIAGDSSLAAAHTVYLFLGAFVCLYGLASLAIKEKLYMSEAMVAVLVGVCVGPVAARLFSPADAFGEHVDGVTLELTRLVVAIQCMACGVDLPGNYLWRERTSIFVLLGPVMVIMWVVTALGIHLIIGLSVLESLIIAACMTPTDPVLANSIVKGRFAEANIPLNVRLILSAESGANDGLGTPFLLLAFYLSQKAPSAGVATALGLWAGRIVLYQVALSVVFGAGVAWVAREALKLAERSGWIDKESLISFSISLTLFIMGACTYLGLDDILAVFIAGNVLTWDRWFNAKIRETHFQEIIDALLNLAFFVYVGSAVPWSALFSPSTHAPGLEPWRLAAFAAWVLLLRRLPAVVAMYKWIPALKSPAEAVFAGWFGPVGAGAIFYAQTAIVVLGVRQTYLVPLTYFTVLASVLVHGGTVAFFNMSLQRHSSYQNWAAPGSLGALVHHTHHHHHHQHPIAHPDGNAAAENAAPSGAGGGKSGEEDDAPPAAVVVDVVEPGSSDVGLPVRKEATTASSASAATAYLPDVPEAAAADATADATAAGVASSSSSSSSASVSTAATAATRACSERRATEE